MRPLLTGFAILATAATLTACASENSTSGYYGRNGYVQGCSSGNEVAGAVVGGGVGALAGAPASSPALLLGAAATEGAMHVGACPLKHATEQ